MQHNEDWGLVDRVIMRLTNWKIRLRNNTIAALGGYDQHAVGFLMQSAKTLVYDLQAGPAPMVAHIHAQRVAEAICRLDPELGRICGFRRAA